MYKIGAACILTEQAYAGTKGIESFEHYTNLIHKDTKYCQRREDHSQTKLDGIGMALLYSPRYEPPRSMVSPPIS